MALRLPSLVLCTILACTWAISATGQTLPFRHFTTQSQVAPLPAVSATKVIQDRQGYIWIASFSSGLVRYDGQKMVVYTTEDGLGDLNINEILQDQSGHLWVGSVGGLVVSSKPLDELAPGERPVFTGRVDSLDLPSSQIEQHRLVAGRQGEIFAAPGDGGLLRIRTQPEVRRDSIRLATDGPVQSLAMDGNGNLWIGMTGGALLVLERDSMEAAEVAFLEEVANVIKPLADGRLEIGTRRGSVLDITLSNGSISIDTLVAGGGVTIRDLLRLGDRELWTATDGAGVIRALLGTNGRVTASAPLVGQPSRTVDQLFLDREGNIWSAQSGAGVSRLPYNFDALTNYGAEGTGGQVPTLPSEVLLAVHPSMAGPCLFAGTFSRGLVCIDPFGDSRVIDSSGGLPNNRVNALVEDERGTLWIGTHRGLAALSVSGPPVGGSGSGQQVNLFGTSYTLSGIPELRGSMLAAGQHQLVDGRGSTWFSGVRRLSVSLDNRLFHLDDRHGLPPSVFRGTTIDHTGRIWVGTSDRGVYRSVEPVTLAVLDSTQDAQASQTSQAVTLFESVWSEDTGAPSNEVESLVAVDSTVWIGNPAGMFALDALSAAVLDSVTVADGLPAANATSMDRSRVTGSIWVGTNAGLAEVDPSTGTVLRTVTKTDGLVDQEVCFYGSVRVAADGSVHYGTCAGLAIYRPHRDQANPVLPTPRITEYSFSEDAWGRNALDLEYAALSFANEGKVRYRTRLVGYDRDWSAQTMETSVRYTNLSAFAFSKVYTFEVTASNDSGVWAQQPFALDVSVVPAWYLRWWALLLWIGILAVSVWAYVRHKTRQQAIQLEKEREINVQLRRVDKLKDEFLANTSHELRTPLNGIIGIVESLLDGVAGEVTDIMRQNLATVVASGRRLASLVNDILDFSKMAEHDITLATRPVSVRVLADIVLKISEPLLAGKEITLHNQIGKDIPPALADEGRLQQILHNLVGNAIKFTQEGDIRVSAEVQEGMIAVSIADTGIGIPEERREAVFQSFEQVDASTAREYGGTGLGLSITRKLVVLHGGTIDFESEVEKGSIFTFTLPIAEGEAEITEAESVLGRLREDAAPSDLTPGPSGDGAAPDQDVHILVVDDEPVNQQVLANHMAFSNYRLSQAMNGQQALELIRSDEKFDIVLLDIMMPRMSGYEVCEHIREHYLPSELPVIMVTAKNQVSDLVTGFNSGANDYIAKPFSKDELLARIKTHLNLLNINASYSRFLPREFLHYLDKESILDVRLGDNVEKEMSIFVSDIRAFTTISEGMTPSENFRFVNDYMAVAGPVIRDFRGFIDRYTGDSIMGLFAERPDDAVDAAVDTLIKIRELNHTFAKDGIPEVRIGVGVHTGTLRLGIVGESERLQGDIFSDAVNLANRLEGLCKRFGASLLISGDTLSRLHDPARFRTRFLGRVQVAGKNRSIEIHEVIDGDPEDVIERRMRTAQAFRNALESYYAGDLAAARTGFDAVLEGDPADKTAAIYRRRVDELSETGVPDDWDGVETLDSK